MKLCLVATDKRRASSLILAGSKYFLASYLYLRRSDILHMLVKHKQFLIIDSGAHTFQKEGQDTDYDKFVYEYAQWLKKNKGLYDEYVELDIENKVGLKKVEQWREYLTEVVGKPPIVVWHRERGKQYWLYMVKKYPYVGFSGFVKVGNEPEVPDKYIGWFLKTAKEHGAKVHGFGFTRPKLLLKYHFDSVDSSTWVLGSAYGHFYTLAEQEFKMLNQYSKKQGYKKAPTAVRDNLSARAWVQLQYFLEEFWKAKEG